MPELNLFIEFGRRNLTMMNRIAISAALLAGVMSAQAVVTGSMSAMTSFGNIGTGWYQPLGAPASDWPSLGNSTAANTRGIAFANNNLYVATREGGNAISIHDKDTGKKTGTLNMTGVTGGAVVVSAVRTDADGRIYLSNVTTNATTTAVKIYRWDNNSSAPTVVFNSAIPGAYRLGDSMDVIGSGNNVKIALGINNTGGTAPAGSAGYSILSSDPTTGVFSAANYAFGAPVVAGDFRLGITFLDSNTVMGTQGGAAARLTSLTGGLLGTSPLSTLSERGMDYTTIDGVKVLATIDTVSSLVRIYDMTNPSAPVSLASLDLTSGSTIAGNNGLSAVAWGNISGKNATLYALNANDGIQAFNVTVVPEPATMTALAFGLAAMARRRKQK